MDKAVEAERVEMFKVIPRWGYKNLRVTKCTCLKRGKTLYFPTRRLAKWCSTQDWYETAEAAIEARLKDAVDERKEQYKYAENMQAEIDALEALRQP